MRGRSAAAPLLFTAVIAALFYFFTDDMEEIGAQEITNMLENRYQGQVEAITPEDGTYKVDFTTGQGEYEVYVASLTGEVISFEQTESASAEAVSEEVPQTPEYLSVEEAYALTKETVSPDVEINSLEKNTSGREEFYTVHFHLGSQRGQLELNAVNGTVQLFTLEEEKLEPISAEEAVQIAAEEFAGTVDDVDREEKDGRLVYEIEMENEAADTDADILIDAYSGEVLEVESDE